MSAVTGSASRVVAASPAKVWELVSDVTRTGEWSPENEGATWVSGEPGAVGARFRGRNRRGKATWSTTCEVVESAPGRVFAFVVGRPEKPSTTWRYELEPVDGGTRVTESFALPRELGWFSRLTTRLTLGVRDRHADLVRGMEQTLAQLAETAEAQARSSA